MKPLELPTLKKPKLIPMFTMLVQEKPMKIVDLTMMLENAQSKLTLNQNLSVLPVAIIEELTPTKTDLSLVILVIVNCHSKIQLSKNSCGSKELLSKEKDSEKNK